MNEYLREFLKKFKTIPIGYPEAQGTVIYEKNLKSKISCQTPFKEPVAARAVTLALSEPQRRLCR